MLARFSILGLVGLLTPCALGCQAAYDGPPADLVVMNAHVVTIDGANPRAEAVAAIGEKIVAVASNRAIQAYIEEGTTEVIDAEGRLMIPGFNDEPVNIEATATFLKTLPRRHRVFILPDHGTANGKLSRLGGTGDRIAPRSPDENTLGTVTEMLTRHDLRVSVGGTS